MDERIRRWEKSGIADFKNKALQKELVAHAVKGDPMALHHLLRLLHPAMREAVEPFRAQMGAGADDALESAKTRVVLHLGKFKGHGQIAGWARKIAINEALSQLERMSRKRTEALGGSEAHHALSVPDPELESQPLRFDLEKAFGRISEPHRETAALFFQHGLTYEEIAKKLRVPVGTVRSRIFRARAQLQEELEDYRPGLKRPPAQSGKPR